MAERPLNILQITPYYAPAWAYGGSVRVAAELSVRLAARGHIVTVLTTDALDAERRAAPAEEMLDGVRVIRLPNVSNRLAWRRVFLPGGFAHAVAQHAAAADLAHLHEVRSLLNAAALPALLRAGVPYVVSPHGGLPAELGRTGYKHVFDALWGRRLLANACRLHALTAMERDQYTGRGLPAERVALLPNGIDLHAFDAPADVEAFKRRYDIPFGVPVVGFLGRLNAIKGLDVLIEAFNRVRAEHPDAVLVLVGPDDGARPALEVHAQRLGVAGAVRFTGMLAADGDKAAAYRAADVYALPSVYENLPTTVLEAMLNGVPCVVSERAGLADELAQAGVARVYGPQANDTALTGEILRLLADPAAARNLGERGRAYVQARFDWEAVIDRWEAVYRGCAAAR